jgi:hypothetical protein
MKNKETLKRIYKQLVNIYFYPFMFVAAFWFYAYEKYLYLLIVMFIMTIIASLAELVIYLLKKQIKLHEQNATIHTRDRR